VQNKKRVSNMYEAGFERPIFKSAIVKLTAVCNLDCSYCYMFNQQDKTFERVPRNLPLDDGLLLLRRIEDYCRDNALSKFSLTLHGGEPTLWPRESFQKFLAQADLVRQRGLNLNITLQTNGYRLDMELLKLFKEHRVVLGVSLDGPREYNDARRYTHARTGSHDNIVRNLRLLKEGPYSDIVAGVLCVADPTIPPERFFDWIQELPVRRFDLLWPMEFSYSNPPWRGRSFDGYCEHPAYGEWFSSIFKLWYERDDPSLFIRVFFESILVLLGSSRHTDMLVNDTIDMIVVNTDGTIEYHDFLRSAGDGLTRTRYNLREHDFNHLADDETFTYLHNLGRHLPTACGDCPHVSVCGGGFLPGRMNKLSKLPTHRSVMCPDQYRFFQTVHEAMRASSSSGEVFSDQVPAPALPPRVGEILESLTVNHFPVLPAELTVG
jgi:uncharacterized protein